MCSPHTRRRHSPRSPRGSRSSAPSPACRPARSGSEPRPPRAPTYCQTHSAASAGTYPGVDVEVEIAASGEILRRLLSGRIELAIVGVDQADERVALEPFLADEIVGVAKAGLVATDKGQLDPKALEELTLLCREPDSSSRGYVERELRTIGVQPARVWELGSTEAVKRAAREGLGVGFLSRYAVAEETERGELDAFRLRGRKPLSRDFHIARLATRPLSPAETAFIATLTRCCAKQSAYAEACVANG